MRDRPSRSAAWAVLTTALLLALAGCGRSAPGARFTGHRVVPARELASLTLPEVREDGSSRPFALRARPGGVLVVYFGFVSCPDVCPTTLADLRKALELLEAESSRVDVAFVTVDPVRDTAAVIAPYLASFFPAGHALRPADQAQLGRAQAGFKAASSVVRRPDGTFEVSHTPLMYAVDDRARVRLEWSFGTVPARLAQDLRLLLRAGSEAP